MIKAYTRKCFLIVINNLKTVKIQYWWLILLSALIHRLPFAMFPRETFVDAKRIGMVVSYILLLWALSLNFGFRSIRILTLGVLFNFAAIITNGGLMPVSPEARQLAHMLTLDQSQFGMILPEGSGVLLPLYQTNLWFLTDIIPVSHLGGVYSAGDVLISAGLLIFFPEVALRRNTIITPAVFSGCEGDNDKI